jgi:hypothetical protein
MLTVKEGVAAHDKARYGVAIDVRLAERDTVESEFLKLTDLLVELKKTRGTACGAITIDYYVEDSLREEIRRFWETKLDHDAVILSLFTGVKVSIGLMSPDGRNYFGIGVEF